MVAAALGCRRRVGVWQMARDRGGSSDARPEEAHLAVPRRFAAEGRGRSILPDARHDARERRAAFLPEIGPLFFNRERSPPQEPSSKTDEEKNTLGSLTDCASTNYARIARSQPTNRKRRVNI